MNDVRESLRKICQALNEHQVEYMLIGGVAVGFHGFPRSTADIDFWYNPTISNFSKLISGYLSSDSGRNFYHRLKVLFLILQPENQRLKLTLMAWTFLY